MAQGIASCDQTLLERNRLKNIERQLSKWRRTFKLLVSTIVDAIAVSLRHQRTDQMVRALDLGNGTAIWKNIVRASKHDDPPQRIESSPYFQIRTSLF
jgi:hypothetical protein